MATTDYAARLQLALADLADQDTPNYLGTSKKFGVDRRTLRERFLGTRRSRKEAIAEYHQCLSIAQEDALVGLINRLTNRGLPPTNSTVKNLAKEMIQHPVSKNWSNQFVARHQHDLTSAYLKNINKKRVKAEYAPMFK